MIDISLIRKEYSYAERKLKERDCDVDLAQVKSLDEARRTTITNLEEFRRQKGELSQKMGLAKRDKNDTLFQELSESVVKISSKIETLEAELAEIEPNLHALLIELPNILHDSVPIGKDESENETISHWGTLPEFSFTPLNHWDILEPSGILDLQRGSKISKSRFAVLRSDLAKLERALINFMIDTHTSNGYEELSLPYLVNQDSMFSSGQYPKFKDDMFTVPSDGLYLVPTTEVPLVNMHRDEIIEERDLPISYTSYSSCFRREAGSYGRDVRGLIRQHQFQKVELVKFTTPETSYMELDNLVASASGILQALKLHHRTIMLCSGDTGFGSSKTFDLEVWLPGQQTYREISSCSNCVDFQARRGNIRYRPTGSKPQLLHTLNGSGLAIGRTTVAIAENYQQEDLSIIVPDVLQSYMNGVKVINLPS